MGNIKKFNEYMSNSIENTNELNAQETNESTTVSMDLIREARRLSRRDDEIGILAKFCLELQRNGYSESTYY